VSLGDDGVVNVCLIGDDLGDFQMSDETLAGETGVLMRLDKGLWWR